MNQAEVMDVNAKSRGKRAAKKLRRIIIEAAKNGGHTVEHPYQGDEPWREPELHVFGKGEHEKMLAHVANALKLPEASEGGEEGEGAAGAAY